MGASHRKYVGCLSGPSHAEEVIEKLPTSVVCSAYEADIMQQIHDLFSTPFFRVYPNSDINGVAFGGAMKNIIAIAWNFRWLRLWRQYKSCSDDTRTSRDSQALGDQHAKYETLNGLSGLGDLCVTCLSKHSRNYKFGHLMAEGLSPEEGKIPSAWSSKEPIRASLPCS